MIDLLSDQGLKIGDRVRHTSRGHLNTVVRDGVIVKRYMTSLSGQSWQPEIYPRFVVRFDDGTEGHPFPCDLKKIGEDPSVFGPMFGGAV